MFKGYIHNISFSPKLTKRPNKIKCVLQYIRLERLARDNIRASPEPTQLEHLSGASFLGKLLVLPANVRPDWKEIARYKHSNLFGLIVSNEGKKFNNVDTRWSYQKH
jgi:hypothetical protein